MYVTVSHRFWDIARYWSNIADCNLPHLCLATPLEFQLDLWHRKTKAIAGLSYDVLCVILRLAVLVQCRLVTNRRTDGHTTAHTALAYSRAVFILAPQDPGGTKHIGGGQSGGLEDRSLLAGSRGRAPVGRLVDEVSQKVKGFCIYIKKNKFCHYVEGHGTTEVISVWRVERSLCFSRAIIIAIYPYT